MREITCINNRSGKTGVIWSKQREHWIAIIQFNKKRNYLGSFEVFADAVKARISAEKAYDFLKKLGATSIQVHKSKGLTTQTFSATIHNDIAKSIHISIDGLHYES